MWPFNKLPTPTDPPLPQPVRAEAAGPGVHAAQVRGGAGWAAELRWVQQEAQQQVGRQTRTGAWVGGRASGRKELFT